MRQLLVAGNETTTNLLSQLVVHFADQLDWWARMRADRDLIPLVVEEGLRINGSTRSGTISPIISRSAGMQLAVNLKHAAIDPVPWARRREAQGWDVLSVTDHFMARGQPFPHVWVTASAVATITARARVMTAFANNLVRGR